MQIVFAVYLILRSFPYFKRKESKDRIILSTIQLMTISRGRDAWSLLLWMFVVFNIGFWICSSIASLVDAVCLFISRYPHIYHCDNSLQRKDATCMAISSIFDVYNLLKFRFSWYWCDVGNDRSGLSLILSHVLHSFPQIWFAMCLTSTLLSVFARKQ